MLADWHLSITTHGILKCKKEIALRKQTDNKSLTKRKTEKRRMKETRNSGAHISFLSFAARCGRLKTIRANLYNVHCSDDGGGRWCMAVLKRAQPAACVCVCLGFYDFFVQITSSNQINSTKSFQIWAEKQRKIKSKRKNYFFFYFGCNNIVILSVQNELWRWTNVVWHDTLAWHEWYGRMACEWRKNVNKQGKKAIVGETHTQNTNDNHINYKLRREFLCCVEPST